MFVAGDASDDDDGGGANSWWIPIWQPVGPIGLSHVMRVLYHVTI